MNLTRYDPFTGFGFSGLPADLNRYFGRWLPEEEGNTLMTGWIPAVDIKETDDAYTIDVDIPGVDAKDIEVTLENGQLSISGKRDEEKTEKHEHFRRTERVSGQFFRRFMLPGTTDAETVRARSEKGVLEITVPKSVKHKARRIEVNA